MRATSRRLSLALLTTVATAAAALPASADTVGVTVTGLGGTRQFAVEDLSGAALTAINLGTGGVQPFRVHVSDSAFVPAAGQGNYSVAATMSNLYLQDGNGGYNYAVKIPSSALSVNFGGTPLSGKGLSIVDLPRLSVSGALSSCATLSGTLKTALGLSGLGAVLDPSNTALASLCTQLGASGGTVSGTIDGALQTLNPTITSILDLPSVLSGATGGTFTNASYAAGTVGAGDTSGASGAAPATAVSLMTGSQSLSAGLVSALTSSLTSALSGLPLVAASGATKTTPEAVIAKLTSSSNALTATFGSVLNSLSSANQISVINSVLSSVTPVAPVLADLKGVTGSFYSFPVLTAAPTAPTAGTYGGTMTVTFVQS